MASLFSGIGGKNRPCPLKRCRDDRGSSPPDEHPAFVPPPVSVGNMRPGTTLRERARSVQEQVMQATVHFPPHPAAGGHYMKKLILAAAAVALMSTGAPAQTTVTTGAARANVQIEPEART